MKRKLTEFDEEPLPLEMQLDLLVDEELPEDQRRTLLRALDRSPEKWRELSIRFLERQVERRGVRDLIAGGTVMPPMVKERGGRSARIGRLVWPGAWVRSMSVSAVAAGVAIALGSALVTSYLLHGGTGTVKPAMVAADRGGGGGGADDSVVQPSEVFNAALPGSAVGLRQPLAVQVPVRGREGDGAALFPAGSERHMRRSVVIQPDGSGNAVIIPVNTVTVY